MTGPASMTTPTPEVRLSELLFGYRISQAISVATSLGVADALAAGGRRADDLAATLGADPVSLYRLLRLLAAAGVLEEDGDRRFTLTPVGELLRADAPGSMREPAILQGRPEVHSAYANLEQAIRTGENAFESHFGESVWAWRSGRPDEASQFNRAMAAWSTVVAPALAGAFDFGSAATVADIGGGSGALMAGVLAQHPGLRGIVFDQPGVVAEADPVLVQAGVRERADLVGGDFFVDVPSADVYVMKSILHDWDDDESVRILRTIRSRAASTASLLLVERVLGGPNEDLPGKLSDLHMLVMPGGAERTLEEWRELLSAGGWALRGTTPLVAGWQLIEAATAA
jgi:O-methyltransferase/methyltransferase family protein